MTTGGIPGLNLEVATEGYWGLSWRLYIGEKLEGYWGSSWRLYIEVMTGGMLGLELAALQYMYVGIIFAVIL